MNQIFTSKANTLMLLQKKVKNSKIEKIFYFKVKEWFEDDEKLLERIPTIFKTGSVVIRSSALGEDSIDRSEAGKYQSILDVDPNDKRKLKKVKKVLGKNTVSAVRSGFYWGYIGLVQNIVNEISKQTKKKFKIILTGGFSSLFFKAIKQNTVIDKDITIKGLLKIINLL